LSHILVIDDNVTNLKLAEQVLKNYYKVTLLTSGEQALKFLSKAIPDLVLLDINMPGLNGFETYEAINSMYGEKKIPVIFLTAQSDVESEVAGLKMGAVDFITKPFIPETMLSRINSHLELEQYQKNLENIIKDKTETILKMQDAIVSSLVELVELRNGETGGHVKRTIKYLEILSEQMVNEGVYSEYLTDDYIIEMSRSAALHDIGKIGIADSMLLKQASLDQEEREFMKQHTVFGANALKKAMEKTEGSDFLKTAYDMALSHHEWFNGKGYPNSISGYDIPLSARIMAVADVYDALTTERPYKKAFSHEKAKSIIIEGKGTQFEPAIIDVFEKYDTLFEDAAREFDKELI